MSAPENPREAWSPSDYMKRDLFVFFIWEATIEARRSKTIYKRIARLFYVSDRRSAEIIAELNAGKYTANAQVYSPQLTTINRTWSVAQEIYVGGYCRQMILCQGVYITHVEGGHLAAVAEIKRLEKRIKLWQALAALQEDAGAAAT
jgi:hypothetical protein